MKSYEIRREGNDLDLDILNDVVTKMAQIEGFDVGGEPLLTQVGLSGPEKRDTVPSGQRSVSWSRRRRFSLSRFASAEKVLRFSQGVGA